MSSAHYSARFTEYFAREIAERAASSLKNGSEIELRVSGPSPEVFTFTRETGKNKILSNSARDPQMTFTVTPGAADVILADTSTDIGTLGVGILKLVVSPDPAIRVEVRVHAGVLSLLSKGYFGVLATGGAGVMSFMAARGLGGIGAIKNALKKMQEGK